MIRTRIHRKTKERFKKIIEDIVDNLGRDVIVYSSPSAIDCPNCYYDKFTESSTGTCKWSAVEAIIKQEDWESLGNTTMRYKYFLKGRCPICLGKGRIETNNISTINAMIDWDFNNQDGNTIIHTPAGFEGSTIVALKTKIDFLEVFENCISVVVDGIICKLATPPIIRGLGNQAILTVILYTDDKVRKNIPETIKEYR